MLPEIQKLVAELEFLKAELIKDLNSLSDSQLRLQPTPDRWSMLMAMQHIVLGEQAIRRTQPEFNKNPAKHQVNPEKMFDAVMNVLEKDIPVEVPDPAVEPDGSMGLDELIALWKQERKQLRDLLDEVAKVNSGDAMFSHPVAGPLDPIRTMQLAIAHFNTHRRQIDRLMREIQSSEE